jgi:ubiquinone/menaquinone biosynthesis C-methylase UbiE
MPGGAYWDAVAESPDTLPPGWRRHGREQHLALLGRWIGPPAGRWLKTDLFEELSEHRALLPSLGSAAWVGTDVSLEVARRSVTADRTPVVGDVRRLPFADACFDGVLSTSTLDHFDHPRHLASALAELRRVLRTDGRLVLTLDNPRNPLVRLRNALPAGLARRTGLVPFSVGATLDEPGGRRALVAAGFTVEASTHLLHAPHVVGTRPARYGWYERRVLPATDRLGATRIAPWSGHFVAFLARPAA